MIPIWKDFLDVHTRSNSLGPGRCVGPFAGACGEDDEAASTANEAVAADNSDAAVDTSAGRDLAYAIVDTNQGTCYDTGELIDCPGVGEAFYGQDAQYTGNTPSYTDNEDGTVNDDVTGLLWTQDLSDASMPWSDAAGYCESLTTGDVAEWRLPNIDELWSIRDFSAGWPWVDTDYFYLVGDGTHGAGAVRFDTKNADGPDGIDAERGENYVRLVRGGDVTATSDGDPTTVNPDRVVEFEDGETSVGASSGGTEDEEGAPADGAADPQGPDMAAAAAELGITVEELQTALGAAPGN